MSEQNVLKTHPLIIKIDEAVGKHINAFGQALKAVVSQCPILQSIRDPSTPKEQRDIDTWLLSITEEQWYDFSDEEVPTLGFARKTLLVKAVRTEVQHLQADIPNRFPDPKMAQYPKRLEACILNFEADTSAPIWVLCEMAAHIAGARYHIEWICAETLGRQRMLQCLGRKTTEEEAVLEWLYARWGHQIWPSGIPKDVATAHAMVGSTSTRTAKLIARGNKHVAVTSLLTKQDTGLQEAITKLKEEDKTWWVSNTDSLSVLAKLRSEMEEENCSSFWLDGAGWNAVGASTLQNHLDWDWVPRPLGPCFIGDLEASSERQIQRKIVNR